jgi:hypothetical protein
MRGGQSDSAVEAERCDSLLQVIAQVLDAEIGSVLRACRGTIQERTHEHQVEVRQGLAIEHDSPAAAFHGVDHDSEQLPPSLNCHNV